MFWQAMTSGMFWKTVILARMDSCFRLMKGRHHDGQVVVAKGSGELFLSLLIFFS
jgi:hypothetical protein